VILLIGATGTIGSRVTALLAGRGDLRALAHSDASARALAERGIATVRGDLADPATLGPAFARARRALLVTPFSREQVTLETNAIDAAQAAGVERVVKLSVMDAAPGVEVAMTRSHREVERRLCERGIGHTVLRPDWFASNVTAQIDLIRGGVITYPYGDAVTAPIDPRDIAEVAALALTTDDLAGQVVELTGPEAMTFRQSADRIAAVTGRPLTFVDATADDWRAGLVAFGIEAWRADALVELIEGYSRRTEGPVRPGVERALGRPPRSFETYLREQVHL
jgi:uncharacterized protein YbjT (DUF2867 family)